MNNYLRHFAIFLFIILSLFLVYAPAFQGHYVFGEDYWGLWTSKWPLLGKKSFISFIHDFPFEGRPLKDLYLYVIYLKYINPLKTLDAANTVRFVNIIAVGLLACILYLIFKVNKFKTLHAILLSILICTLPPFQTYVGRICCGAFTYSAFFSALAALILFITVFKKDRKIGNMVIGVLMATVLLTIALNFYQSAAMTYWALALVPLMILKDEDFIKRWTIPFIIYFFTGLISILLYYIIIKIMLFLIDFTTVTFTQRGSVITINEIYPKVIDFINYPLYTALNLWNIFPDRIVGLSVSIGILAGILYGFGRVLSNVITGKNDKKILFNSLCRYSPILIILPLSYLPNIAIKEGFNVMIPKFRTLIGLETTVVLLLYWGLFINIPDLFRSFLNFSLNLRDKLITFGLIILTMFATFYAYQNINNFVKLHTGELEYVKNAIQEYGIPTLLKNQKSKICIIISDREATNYHSIFINLTSMWKSSSHKMLNVALYELGIHSEIPTKAYKNYENLPQGDKNKLIIDMRKYQKRVYKELNIPLNVEPFF
jgi:hypothetical protein